MGALAVKWNPESVYECVRLGKRALAMVTISDIPFTGGSNYTGRTPRTHIHTDDGNCPGNSYPHGQNCNSIPQLFDNTKSCILKKRTGFLNHAFFGDRQQKEKGALYAQTDSHRRHLTFIRWRQQSVVLGHGLHRRRPLQTEELFTDGHRLTGQDLSLSISLTGGEGCGADPSKRTVFRSSSVLKIKSSSLWRVPEETAASLLQPLTEAISTLATLPRSITEDCYNLQLTFSFDAGTSGSRKTH